VEEGSSTNGWVQILVIDDCREDARLVEEALHTVDASLTVEAVHSAEAGIERIRTVPRPTLVLLDLDLGPWSGHDVLAEIKADAGCRAIPVVVLSASGSAADVRMAYAAHASGFLRKPTTFAGFTRVATLVCECWLDVILSPGVAEAR
jgi:CheY-like chemotaxis protein